jgi:hypothetical protein
MAHAKPVKAPALAQLAQAGASVHCVEASALL